jgi:2-dehydropantoate 2-reductase
MRILIVGAGALGGYVGASLARAGEDVVLLDLNQARTRLLNEQGLLISQAGQPASRFAVKVVTSVEGLAPFDLVFIAVKTYQTEDAVREALPAAGPATRFLSMQNGIGNAEAIAGVVGPERVLCGITYHSVQHAGPGRLQYRQGVKPIQIAPFAGEVTPEIEAIGEVFRAAGLETTVVAGIDPVVWQKLLHNAVINPVSALTGLTCREILGDEDLLAFMRDLAREILAVMRARGVPIVDEDDPFRPLIGSLTALGKNRPSMWQDLMRGRRTEVDAINGAVVAEARRLGLEAPHCAALVRFIHSRERQTFLRKQEIARKVEALRALPAEPRVARPTPLGADGGMGGLGPPLDCTRKLKELIRAYYRDLDAASDDLGRQVACCSSLAPVEVVRALGLTPYLPENHAALIAASREGGRYLARATAAGYSQFAGSAMRCDVGALLAGDSPLVRAHGIQGPPRPDVSVYSTNTGRALVNWFQFYGDRYGVPVVGLHPPAELGGLERPDENAVVDQLLRLIWRLEGIARRPLDLDRLAAGVRATAEASRLWGEILDLARATPAPLTFFDTLVHIAPMVLLRGTPEAVDYYRLLRAELEHRVGEGVGAVAAERVRCYWDGPPLWCALRPLARWFADEGIAVVASTFGESFVLSGLDPDDPVASLARAYALVFANRSEGFQTSFLAAQLDEYGVDVALLHDCRTAPQTSHVRYGLASRLHRLTGLPCLVLEADSHDLRLFSLDQLRRLFDDVLAGRDRPAARPVAGERTHATA